MITTKELNTFRQRIESELAGMLEWIEAPEIRGVAKDRLMQRQDLLHAAFIRIQKDTFGCCIACGKAIEPVLLRTDPATSLCAPCNIEKHTGHSSNDIQKDRRKILLSD